MRTIVIHRWNNHFISLAVQSPITPSYPVNTVRVLFHSHHLRLVLHPLQSILSLSVSVSLSLTVSLCLSLSILHLDLILSYSLSYPQGECISIRVGVGSKPFTTPPRPVPAGFPFLPLHFKW